MTILPAPSRHQCRKPRDLGTRKRPCAFANGREVAFPIPIPPGTLWLCECGAWWVKVWGGGGRTPRTAHIPDWRRVGWLDFGLRRRIRRSSEGTMKAVLDKTGMIHV